MLLAVFVFVPLLDLTIVPIRWMMAQELVNSYSRKLALCDTFSEAMDTLEADPSLSTQLHHLGGITVNSVKARLLVTRVFPWKHAEESTSIEVPRRIPSEWLPNGSKAPCSYALEVNVQSLMSPAVLFRTTSLHVPGLTDPIPLTVRSSHSWENLGRNPVSKNYFMNE